MRDKSYRSIPLGGEVARYIRWKRSEWGAADNTMLVYEQVLRKLAIHHADLELDDFAPPVGTERVREFLACYWEDAKASTRARNLAVVRDFFRWAVRERGLPGDPTAAITSPRRRGTERRAHSQDLVRQLVLGQDDLRDQVALRLLAQLGLRKNELTVSSSTGISTSPTRRSRCSGRAERCSPSRSSGLTSAWISNG